MRDGVLLTLDGSLLASMDATNLPVLPLVWATVD